MSFKADILSVSSDINFETLQGGQCILSTQLTILNYNKYLAQTTLVKCIYPSLITVMFCDSTLLRCAVTPNFKALRVSYSWLLKALGSTYLLAAPIVFFLSWGFFHACCSICITPTTTCTSYATFQGSLNTLNPIISINIPHTLPCAFSFIMTRRICLTIKAC